MKNTKHLDAIDIGAGFGGMYMLKKLRDEQGLKVRVFDKAGGVGGTWYWNRYPGALSDTETFVYCYSWDKELLQEMHITTRYVTQPQILSYLEHVADRYNLRPDIQLNTGVTAAHFNETTNLWEVKTDTGEAYTAACCRPPTSPRSRAWTPSRASGCTPATGPKACNTTASAWA